MIESTIIGAFLGAGTRIAPEVIKLLDRHLERWHELAMQDKALEFEKVRGPGRVAEMTSPETTIQLKDTLDAVRESYRQQFESKDPKLNKVSGYVRPSTTYILLGTYVLAKVVMLAAAVFSAAPIIQLDRAYSSEDGALLSGVLAYWFLSRSLEKGKA